MNNHVLIEKYTKLVMKRLYQEDVQVFFFDMGTGNKALFRNKGFPPYHITDEWNKSKCNITYHSKIFSKAGDLPPLTWKTIVHEVTHFDVGINQGKKGLKHSTNFYYQCKKNLRQVMDLHQKFLEAYETSG